MGIAVGSGGLAFYLAAFHSRTMKTQIHSTIFDIQVSGVAVLFEKYSSSLSHVPPLLMPYVSVLFGTTIVVPQAHQKIAQK
jgi:hypothetical protein